MAEDQQILIGFDYALASQDVIEVLIDDIEDPGLFDEIARANVHRPEILNMLIEHPDTPAEVRKFISETLSLPVRQKKEEHREHIGKMPEMRRESLTTKIQKLSVSQRVQLALKGGREIRGILSHDSNKEVMLSVLENGKVTDAEIEMLAKSRSVLEEALRRISKNREWMKSYQIVVGLVNNPKTPAGIAVTHVTDLRTKDMILLERNKNVAEAVRSAAKRVIAARKPR